MPKKTRQEYLQRDRVREWMRATDTSATELARRCNMSNAALSSWLTGATLSLNEAHHAAVCAVLRTQLAPRGASVARATRDSAVHGDDDADTRTMAQRYRSRALATLAELMANASSDAVKADCAKMILAIVDGKPRQSDPPKKSMEPSASDAELISELKRLAAEPSAPATTTEPTAPATKTDA